MKHLNCSRNNKSVDHFSIYNAEPLLIIFEYCPFSNLRTHMITCRRRFINQLNEYGNLTRDNSQEQKNTKDTFNTGDLINWAYQISRGMAYLALKKVYDTI